MRKCLLFFLLLLLPLPSFAQEPLTLYSQATRDARSGDEQKARAAFQALRELAEKNPDHKLADDALYQAAETAERYLSDYPLALETYRLVIERYPASKSAMRAKRALERLQSGLQTGQEAYRLYQDTLRLYARIGSEEALQRMKTLHDRYPDFAYADRVSYWIGEELARREENEAAIPYYQEVVDRWPDTLQAFLAQVGIGNAYIEQRKFTNAIEAYRRLATMKGSSNALHASRYYVDVTHEFLMLWIAFWINCLLLLVWLLRIGLFTPWKNVQPRLLLAAWPELAVLALPLTAGLIYVWNRSLYMRHSLLWLLAGGAAAAVINVIYLQLKPAGSIRRAWNAAFNLLAGFALTYVIFYLTDLINVLRDSLKMTFNQ